MVEALLSQLTVIDPPGPGGSVLVASSNAALAVLGGLALLVALLVVYFIFGSGPRRRRAFHRARRALDEGDWKQARDIIRQLRETPGLSEAWDRRLVELDGECLNAAGDEALKNQRFAESLQWYRAAGDLLPQEGAGYVGRVLQAMLVEARRLFCTEEGKQDALPLLDQALNLDRQCAEAHFWRGLCLARDGRLDQAVAALEQAHALAGKQVIDPPLYLGILLSRLGRHQDSLRALADANRVDAGCPFVALQMGLSMVAAGGDSGMAVRALQKALGPRGLPLWNPNPQRAWVEAFPQNASFVRRAAEKHPFTCPLLGNDVAALQRQGWLAAGQAYYRQGNYSEAATVFGRLLDEMPPTLPLVRGLGLSLTRLGRHDQAFRHLRAAVEMDPEDALTVGHFALCGACAQPPNPEDRPRNIAWALRQIGRFDLVGNAEWARLSLAIHAEARKAKVPLSREDQLRLCDLLISVQAADAEAADAYDHLAVTFPDAVSDEQAWLYARAAHKEQFRGRADLDLLGRAFRDPAAARAYFSRHDWELEEVEYLYLERHAAAGRTGFPEPLGPQYAERGQALLLGRAGRAEQGGDLNAALAGVEVLLQIAPAHVGALDSKARLLARLGRSDEAGQVLRAWQHIAPQDPAPLLRRAVLDHRLGDPAAGAQAIDDALARSHGQGRARIALIGARLCLVPARTADQPATNGQAPSPGDLPRALALLRECLREVPDHVEARWLLAALLCVHGDHGELAAQAPALDRAEVSEPRFHYLGAVAYLVAGQPARVLDCVNRITDPALAVEGRYLAAWAYLHGGQPDHARQALEPVADSSGPSASHARALLGRLLLEAGDYQGAVRWWVQVDPKLRTAWQFDEPLRQTVFLSALTALHQEDHEPAAERFREAGKLGLRDRRLGGLVALSLLKAGQRLLYEGEESR